jgi:hypothetical protein
MLVRLLIGLCVAVAVDCNPPKFLLYKPLELKTAIDEQKLYAATEGTLLDRGYLFQKRDEAAHHMLTQPRTLTGSQTTDTKFKYVWVVDTAGGALKIQLMCQETSATAEPVRCAPEVPEKIVQEQRAIADQALREARGE